jgi:hypothetical protein
MLINQGARFHLPTFVVRDTHLALGHAAGGKVQHKRRLCVGAQSQWNANAARHGFRYVKWHGQQSCARDGSCIGAQYVCSRLARLTVLAVFYFIHRVPFAEKLGSASSSSSSSKDSDPFGAFSIKK